MSTNFIPPAFRDVLDPNSITMPNSNEWDFQMGTPVAPGLYKFTLPDGREILVDENGNIVG